MDKKRLLYFTVLAFLILGLIVTPILPNISAYQIETLWHWTGHSPTVCYWDSDHNLLMDEAIMTWNDYFYEEWGKDGIVQFFRVDGYTEGLDKCNIHIIIVPLEVTRADPENDIYDNPLGSTTPRLDKKLIWIFVYEERSVSSKYFEISMQRTIMHELGHAWGLGHVLPENVYEGLKPHPLTLMWAYQWEPVLIIDNATRHGMKCMYGNDGWAGQNDLCAKKIKVPLVKPESKLG